MRGICDPESSNRYTHATRSSLDLPTVGGYNETCLTIHDGNAMKRSIRRRMALRESGVGATRQPEGIELASERRG
jgi:hypothetical protein